MFKVLLSILKPFFFAILILSFASIYLIKTTKATDATIVCDASGCSGFLGALFNETNTVPGFSTTKSFAVKNERSEALTLTLNGAKKTGTDEEFLSQIETRVEKAGGGNLFLGSLETFLDGTSVNLGSLPMGDSKEYEIALSLTNTAGNEYQGKVANFDLSVNIVGETTGAVLSAASAPVCMETTPSSAPTLSATTREENSILLTWTPVSPITHYMIQYGKSAGVYIYGATNIGNVNSFSVEKLSGGSLYYFQVAGVNGCAPGPWSNEASGATLGPILSSGPAAGFEEKVLGEKEEETRKIPAGVVAGAACDTSNNYWWIFLVQQGVAGFLLFEILKEKKFRYLLSGLILFAVLSQIIHQILGCHCATSETCSKYWLLNLGILLTSGLTFGLLIKKSFAEGSKN